MAQASRFPHSHADAPEAASWVRAQHAQQAHHAQGGLREASLWSRVLGRIRLALWRAAGKG